jgi:hypothetical protein
MSHDAARAAGRGCVVGSAALAARRLLLLLLLAC